MPELLEDVIAKMGVLSATQKHLEVLQCYRDECGGRPLGDQIQQAAILCYVGHAFGAIQETGRALQTFADAKAHVANPATPREAIWLCFILKDEIDVRLRSIKPEDWMPICNAVAGQPSLLHSLEEATKTLCNKAFQGQDRRFDRLAKEQQHSLAALQRQLVANPPSGSPAPPNAMDMLLEGVQALLHDKPDLQQFVRHAQRLLSETPSAHPGMSATTYDMLTARVKDAARRGAHHPQDHVAFSYLAESMQPLIALARLELTPTYKQAETFIKEAWYRLRAVDAGPRDDKPSQEVLLGLCNTFSGAAETLLQADALKYEQPQDRLVEQLEILQVAYKGLQEIAARYNQDWEQALWWAERGRAQALQDQLVRLMHKRNASSGLSQPGGIAQGDSGSKGHASAVSPAGSLAPKSMVQKLPAGVLVVVLTALNANTLGSPLIGKLEQPILEPGVSIIVCKGGSNTPIEGMLDAQLAVDFCSWATQQARILHLLSAAASSSSSNSAQSAAPRLCLPEAIDVAVRMVSGHSSPGPDVASHALKPFPLEVQLEALQQLHLLLLSPLKHHISASTTHIVFLPDQVLARVPFTALHDGVQYLVQRTGVSVSPSLAMLYECLGNSAQAEVCGRWLMISQVDSKAKEERKLVKEVIQTVGAEEGWEVIAQFPDKLATVKPLVEAAVIEHLGSLTAVRLEWGVACTVAYMTFLHAASVDSVNLLISRLARDGVKMAFNKKSDKESEILILDTGSWTWLKLEKPPCIRWVVLITTPAAGYLKKFIVAKGVNLFHRNLVLRYRLHPDPSSHSPVVAFDLVHPDELRELNIQALVAEVDTVDTVAMRAPPEMDSTDVTHLIMEFWQGLRAIGARIKLPLDEYRKQAREQGDSDAEGPATPQRFMLLDVQSDSSGSGSSFPEPQFGEVQALQQSDTLQQTNSRSFQKRRWDWDVFICHAGEDKPFGRLLWDRLVLHDLRAFLDDESLVLGTQVDQSLERAAKSTQIAVVLLSREFFQKEWPRKELGWFLSHAEATRAQVIPVFLRITADECAQLAGDDALAAVCNIGGIRHAGEQYLNMPVYEQRTIEQIVEEICCRTGVAYRGCD